MFRGGRATVRSSAGQICRTQVLRAVEASNCDGRKLLATDMNDLLDDLCITQTALRAAGRRKIQKIRSTDTDRRRQSIMLLGSAFPSVAEEELATALANKGTVEAATKHLAMTTANVGPGPSAKPAKPAPVNAQVSATMYSMFPEFDKDTVNSALEVSGGSESEMLDYLFALQIAMRTDIKKGPEKATPMCSETKAELNDDDIYDDGDFVEGFPASAGYSDEDIYIDIAEMQANANSTLINNMRGCLDQVVGEGTAGDRRPPAALFDPALDGEMDGAT